MSAVGNQLGLHPSYTTSAEGPGRERDPSSDDQLSACKRGHVRVSLSFRLRFVGTRRSYTRWPPFPIVFCFGGSQRPPKTPVRPVLSRREHCNGPCWKRFLRPLPPGARHQQNCRRVPLCTPSLTRLALIPNNECFCFVSGRCYWVEPFDPHN
jgi:hypothetical protein